jgi:two-component system, OmpR family, phosphate regulon sensor histidine kinase PhoR
VRRTLAGRLLAAYAATVLAVLALLAVVLDRTLEREFLQQLTVSLEDRARAVQATVTGTPGLQSRVEQLGQDLGVRLTVIRTDGVVAADSAGDPATFENHAGRPEVRAALTGRVGVDSRVSASVGRPYRYVALPPKRGLIFRAALPLSVVEDRLRDIRALVVGGCLLAALVGIGVAWVVGRAAMRPLRRMTAGVERMSGGNLAVRVPEGGSAELALLAATLNRMAEELGSRIEQVGKEREQLTQILSAMEEGVVLVGDGHGIRFANPAAVRLLGGRGEELRDLGPASLRSVIADVERTDDLAQREVETGVPVRTLLATAVRLRGGQGVLLVLRDVTEARRVEAMRRDFVADASHELKTPTAAIQATAETMERALVDDPEAATRFAAHLRREADRLTRIVSDLLDLSRLETEASARQDLRFDEVVREESVRLAAAADAAGVRLELATAPALVAGDSEDLALLVGNLLDNAIRYTPRGGLVRVEVAESDGHATLTVTDSGIGIPSRDLPRIFERFYRVDQARSRETGGTGLGLSIARHVAEQHGGSIEAESELGSGSTFRVRLPMRRADLRTTRTR